MTSLLASHGTDWFSFMFWEVRKSRLGKGAGFSAADIHLERGLATLALADVPRWPEDLGPAMNVPLHVDDGPDPLAPVPFGLIPLNRLLGLLPVYDLEDRWASAADRAARASPSDSARYPTRHGPMSTTPTCSRGSLRRGWARTLLQRRAEGGYEIDLRHLARYEVRPPFAPYGARLLSPPRWSPRPSSAKAHRPARRCVVGALRAGLRGLARRPRDGDRSLAHVSLRDGGHLRPRPSPRAPGGPRAPWTSSRRSPSRRPR